MTPNATNKSNSLKVPPVQNVTEKKSAPVIIVWKNVVVFVLIHIAAMYGLYLLLTGQVKILTFVFAVVIFHLNGIGITAGAHRYWAHKSYKANFPLRVILCLAQTGAIQNSIFEWSRDHRLHHKFTETDADPHNAKRGFFFAHVGWLLSRKHEEVKAKGRNLEMTDLKADPIVMFQHKYYKTLVLLVAVIAPSYIATFCWGESLKASYFFLFFTRYVYSLHATWLVNSAAHLYGSKPYDKTINPSENRLVALLALGEGWHNYHHVFPWDYKTSEFGSINFTKHFVDFFAKIGWAYDLKTVSNKSIVERIAKTGDGTHEHFHGGPWGWGDKDIPAENIEATELLYPIPEESTVS